MAPLRLAGLFVVAVALLAPSVAAASAQGVLEVGSARLSDGARVDAVGLDVLSLASTPVLELAARDVVVHRLGSSSTRVSEPAPVSHEMQAIDERATFSSATLSLLPVEGEQVVALRALGPAVATLDGASLRGVGGARLANAYAASGGGIGEAETKCAPGDFMCLDAWGVYEIVGAASAEVSGEIVLLLYGATLRVVADGASREFASGVDDTRGAGPVAATEDAWVVVRAKEATGSVSSSATSLFAAAPTVRASEVRFEDADGHVRVGAVDYRASRDDVQATGEIVLAPGAVPAAAQLGSAGAAVYAESFRTRVSGDIASIDLAGSLAFLDSPAERAGFAALVAALAAAIAYGWQHLTFAAAALYTRLNKPDILENDVRNHIYDIIRQNPGISAREVHRRSSQSWGTVVYHLRQLERHHLVVSRALGRTRNYYENHGKYRGMEAQLACLQSERARVLARAIQQQPGITQEQLAGASGFPQPTTSYYVRKLKQAGLVEEQRDGRYVKYVPHAELERFLTLSESSVQAGAGPAGSGVQA